MVVDSSALVAILLREPEAEAFTAAVLGASRCSIGAPSYLETVMVLVGRHGPPARGVVDRLVVEIAAEVVAFTPVQARRAIEAFMRYGKGRGHPANLNFGDCCSHALAIETGSPLLFKGDDFAQTDVVPALGRRRPATGSAWGRRPASRRRCCGASRPLPLRLAFIEPGGARGATSRDGWHGRATTDADPGARSVAERTRAAPRPPPARVNRLSGRPRIPAPRRARASGHARSSMPTPAAATAKPRASTPPTRPRPAGRRRAANCRPT